MASGSSGRVNPGGSKGFDFGSSDDILCSYEDYENQDSSNGRHSDPVISSNSVKDFHKSRMTRPSAFPATYEHSEDSLHQEVVSTVERAMKRHTDGVMRFLEGISSRLSQLELYCYNVDKSIGEMRSELARDHAEADSKLKAVEKHLQEVHRSVQILRDKQELADTQKELAKLHTAQKESSSSSHSQSNDEKAAPTSDTKKAESTPEPNNQLALALPHQVAPQQQQPPALPPSTQTVPQNVMQQQPYYMSPPQLPAPPAPTQHQQGQYLAADSQYRPPQMQDISRVTPQAPQAQVNQPLPGQQYPNYQQQWSQQMQPPQQAPLQTPHMRPQPTSYPAYPPSCQQANPSPQETMPTSMAPQLSYSGIPQPMSSRADALPYGYGAGRTVPQQPPPQQVKGTYGVQPGDGYSPAGPHPAPPPGSTYMMYDTEGRPSHFAQAVYPPPNLSLQTSQPGPGGNMSNRTPSHPQFVRSHPYNDLIEKLVSMGFRGDHVVSIIQRMEENGQPVDFNSVLDRLSSQTSGGSQRGWSG